MKTLPHRFPLLALALAATAWHDAPAQSPGTISHSPDGVLVAPKLRAGPDSSTASTLHYYLDSTGDSSTRTAVTMILRPVAEGWSSAAIGAGARASGNSSLALGRGALVREVTDDPANDSPYSVAIGATAAVFHSEYSAAIGGDAFAGRRVPGATNITSAYAFGTRAKAMGSYTMALGFNTEAGLPGGDLSHAYALGSWARAHAEGSVAIGRSATAWSYWSTAVGPYPEPARDASGEVAENASAWDPGDPIFVIGNGMSSGARSNALRVLKDGTVLVWPRGGLSMGSFTAGRRPAAQDIYGPQPAE